MTNKERIKTINEAIVLIERAKEMVEESIKDTSYDDYTYAYGLDGFDTLLGMDRYSENTLFTLIDEIVCE